MLNSSVWRTYTAGLQRADVAAVLLSTAGAIHLGAAPQHWGHSPAHGLFLFAVGLAELVWAAAFWRRASRRLRTVGVVLAGASIVLWALTRVLPAPFGHGPEAPGVADVASKLPELLVLGILGLDDARARTRQRRREPAWLHVAGLLGVATAAAALTFWLAAAAEPALPWFGGDTRASENATAAAAVRARPADAVQVVVAGIGAPLATGEVLPIAGDLLAQITATPGGARFSRNLDLHLLHAGGMAASDATIVAAGHMRFMDHGSFRQAATSSGDGEYALQLAFVMPGEWQVDLEIVTPAARGAVQLDFDLID
jgi:hypothetical protein